MSSISSAVGPLGTLGLVDDLGVRLFDFSVEPTLIDVDLEDLSDLPDFRPLSRSVTGEIDVAAQRSYPQSARRHRLYIVGIFRVVEQWMD